MTVDGERTKRASTGYGLVATAACMWGTWPLILQHAESYGKIPSALESAMVMFVLTLVSGPLALRDRVRFRASARGWAGVVWLGVADAMNIVCYFRALQLASVAVAVLTHYLAPLFVAVAAPLVLRERRDARTTGAVLISFVGLAILLEPWAATHRPGDAMGALFGAGSAFFYASNVIANKRLVGEFSGSEMMFFHGLVATPLLLAMVPAGAWSALDPRAFGYLLIGSLGPGALGGLLFVWGIRRIRASHAATLALIEPLVAVLVAAMVMSQSLSLAAMLGGALILGGAARVVSAPKEPATSS
ncbi:MAG: DMT family transporter [Polyangiaceae bacterium]